MHQSPIHRMSSRRGPLCPLLVGALLLALAAALAACGTSSSAQSFPTATDIPATPGTAQLNGCAAQQAPAAAKTADVVAQGGGETTQTSGQPVTLHAGQTLQVRLPATYRWGLAVTDANAILTQPAGNGWFDEGLKACVWQFTAGKAGSASLSFGGGQVCSSSSKCPNLVIEQSFSITVQ